jgi:hypothetical protein
MTVGPMSLAEHLTWFTVLSLFVFLVYNALHVDSVKVAVRHGLRRWIVFVLGTAVLALISTLLSHYL